jgi:hypothetical protein
VILPSHRIALAVGEPHEARLLAILEDPAFQVAGRCCGVTVFCSTIREVRDALGRTDSVDAVVMSSTLQAVPSATLRELVQIGRPLVLLVPDPTATHWTDVPVPVLGLDADGAGLAAAIGDALLGGRPARARSTRSASSSAIVGRQGKTTTRAAAVSTVAPTVQTARSEVITVTSAETPDGRTAAVAVPLAYALSFAGPTVLLDVNSRGSGVEFHLPVDPALGLPQLGRRTHDNDGSWSPAFQDEEAWRAALEAELQPMGPTGQGWVACGVSTPAYRQHLTAALLERAIATLRTSRRFIVLDSSGGGWAPEDPALDRAALVHADRLLVVLRPDEQGISRTKRVLRNWPHRERISLVLNQIGLPGTDEVVGAIEYELGAPVVASLPFDPHHLAAARVHNRPVVTEPGARLSEPLLALATRLAGGGPIRLPSSPPPRSLVPWWRRLPVGATGVFR